MNTQSCRYMFLLRQSSCFVYSVRLQKYIIVRPLSVVMCVCGSQRQKSSMKTSRSDRGGNSKLLQPAAVILFRKTQHRAVKTIREIIDISKSLFKINVIAGTCRIVSCHVYVCVCVIVM